MTTVGRRRRGGVRQRLASLMLAGALCGLAGSTISTAFTGVAHAADATSAFQWNPVRLGAGGFVTGFVTHPLNPVVRYCRTDVGNAYRWDNTNQQWVPMLIHNPTGSAGIPAAAATAPGIQGVASIAIDPSNTNIVYLATTFPHSNDVQGIFPNIPGNVYKSVDGGRTFTAGNLAVFMQPNDQNYRSLGERLVVDPHNSSVLYYGAQTQGLWRSIDGGATWSQVTGGGAPGATINIFGVRFAPTDGTTSVGGQTVSKSIYLVSGNLDSNNHGTGGSVYKTSNGGAAWTVISAGSGVDNVAGDSAVGPDGSFYVTQIFTSTLWKYNSGTWTSSDVGGEIDNVGVDPNHANTIYTEGQGGQLHRSLNGIAGPWVYLGSVGTQSQYAAPWAWLPQQDAWRSTSAVVVDNNGTLWVAEGNEGMVRCQPTAASSTAKPPLWTIDSKGIEEFVTTDITIPKGGGGNTIVTMEDGTGFVLGNLTQFTAKHVPLSPTFLNSGTSVAYCPNAPSYIALITADVFFTADGLCRSGYSPDGGATWQPFGSLPFIPEQNRVVNTDGYGTVAISPRNGWTTGSDHLVWLPGNSLPPYYSKDGGNTWTRTTSFPLTSTGNLGGPYTGDWSVALRQHEVKADPFTPDRFYMNLVSGGFFISTDGGATWVNQPNAAIPLGDHHGNLEVNYAVKNDLWFVDGWEGAYGGHGLFHSTNGGQNFTQISGIDYAITVSLGKGSGRTGDKPYTVYIYGKLTGDDNWGVFRSRDGGVTWDRASYYPTGIFDWPTCMAASWDTYGKVVIGFSGNSFVYSTYGQFGGTVAAPIITPTSGPKVGDRIAIQAIANGQYVAPNLSNDTLLTANQPSGNSTATYFDIADAGNGSIALWSEGTSHYVTCDLSTSTGVLRANWATSIGGWEPLTWSTNSDGTVSFKSVASGDYITCNLGDGGLLEALSATTIGAAQKFSLIDYGTPVGSGGSVQAIGSAITGGVHAASITIGTGTATLANVVSITDSTPGASIHYTTDGTTPSDTNGTLYVGPVTIPDGATLRAVAYEDGWQISPVVSYACVLPIAPPAPASMSAVAGSTGSKSILVTWGAATGATSYKLYRSTAGGAYSQIYSGTNMSYSDTGLTAGVSYSYEASGVSSVGEGMRTQAATATAR